MSHTEASSLNFHLSEEVRAIKDVAASFADNEIAPHVLHFDETQEFPMKFSRNLVSSVFLGYLYRMNMVEVDWDIRNIP